MADFDHIPGSGALKLEDHRRWPLCRLVLYCADCSWARDYRPDAIACRLQALRVGGYQTPVHEVAPRVAWNCPACRRVHWAATLAYPKGIDPREIARAARIIRS